MGPNPPGPCFGCNQMGHWAKSCPNPRPHSKPCPTCKQWGHWKMDCPQTLPTKSRGLPQAQQQWARNQTQGGPGTPDHSSLDEVRDDPIVPELFQWQSPSSKSQVHPIRSDSELWVIGTVAGHKVSFLIDTGAAFSLLTSFKGPLQPSEVAMKGVSDISFYPKITPPLLCSFGKATLTHSFIVVPQCPMALLGCDLLAKLQTSINLPFLDPISILSSKWHPNPWPALTPKTCPLTFPRYSGLGHWSPVSSLTPFPYRGFS